MTKTLHDAMSRNDLRTLRDRLDPVYEREFEAALAITDMERRRAVVEHGLLGRLDRANRWLEQTLDLLVTDPDLPAIRMPDHVVVALWDAYVTL